MRNCFTNLMACTPNWTWDYISAMLSHIEQNLVLCHHKHDLRVHVQFLESATYWSRNVKKLIFEVILLIPFYTTLPKRTTIMLQTNPTLLVGLARLHNCCLHVSYWNHHNRIYCHLVPRKNKSLNQPINQRLWELSQINTGLKLKRKRCQCCGTIIVLWC